MKRALIKSISALIVIMTTTSFVACKNNGSGESTSNKDNFNETGYPVVKEEITLKAFALTEPGSEDWNKFKVLNDIDKKTGIDVVYDCIAGTVAEEKKNLMLASNDLPDMFFGGMTNSDIERYSKQGLFVPLNDLIEKYAPNIVEMFEKHPEVKKACTSPDGKIYGLPFVYGFEPEQIPTYIFLNKTWLDKLGLQVPKTTEEFKHVLNEFKTKDPNGNGKQDEIPFTYRADNVWNGDPSFSGPFGVVDNPRHLSINKEGKMEFVPVKEEYKEYLKWCRDLYTNGLIDSEVFTQDQSQYVSKRGATNVGGFLAYGETDVEGIEWICVEPLTGPKGHQIWGSYEHLVHTNRFVLTNANKNPEATMRWINEFYEKENSLLIKQGELLEKADGKYIFNDAPKGKGGWDYGPGPYAVGFISPETFENEIIIDGYIKKNVDQFKLYEKFATEPVPNLFLTSDEENELAILATDINNYVTQMKATWTSGEGDIDKGWDNYVDQMNKMGLDKYIKIYQDAYERYKNS